MHGHDDVQSKWSDLADEWEEEDAKVLLDIRYDDRVVGDSCVHVVLPDGVEYCYPCPYRVDRILFLVLGSPL